MLFFFNYTLVAYYYNVKQVNEIQKAPSHCISVLIDMWTKTEQERHNTPHTCCWFSQLIAKCLNEKQNVGV